MMYVDVSVRNPKDLKHPDQLIPEIPSKVLDGYQLTYGGGEAMVLNISAKFNRISNPVLGILAAKWAMRRHITRKSEVEYRVSYR